MTEKLEFLSAMDYPGRVIIIGLDSAGESVIVVYAITGRSVSSQARQIVVENNHLLVIPTDDAAVKEGNPELLIYPAISISRGIVVSNGKQTNAILAGLHKQRIPADVLSSSLSNWEYEPDSPTFTPRISGCVLSPVEAALGIVRRAEDGSSSREYFPFPLRPGTGKLITTYSGKNIDPLPSFIGPPAECVLDWATAEDTAEAVYAALAGKDRGDFRVAVACVFASDLEKDNHTLFIINRHERILNG